MEFSIHICEYNRSNTDCETIYRPEGSGDYLFLLFKTPMKVYDGTAFIIAQENACLFYTLDHEQHYQAVQKFRNSYVHFWCGENLGEKYGIPQNTVFYPQNTEAIDELIRLQQREYIVKDPYAVEYEEALVRQMMIIDILCHTADSVSTHRSTGTVCVVHIHLEICHLGWFDQNQSVRTDSEMTVTDFDRCFPGIFNLFFKTVYIYIIISDTLHFRKFHRISSLSAAT